MSYTIEIRTSSMEGLDIKTVGRFSDTAWNSLWEELHISKEQWGAWQAAQQDVPLLPDLPEISKLSYIDEGVVHFEPKELNNECVRLISALTDQGAREMIQSLLDASAIALQNESAEIVVHPFPA